MSLIKTGSAVYQVFEPTGLMVQWMLSNDEQLQLLANLAPRPTRMHIGSGRVIWMEGEFGLEELGPWSTLWQVIGNERASDSAD